MNRSRRASRLSLIVRALPFLAAIAIVVAACGGAASPSPSSAAKLNVVATTTVFADIVRNIGGDLVSVESIVPTGAGPEDFEPKPDAAIAISDADLVVSNGVGLDDWLDDLITAAGEGTVPRLILGEGIPTITVNGEPNPHFWLDPSLVRDHYLPAITASLSKLDPADAATFEANRAAYAAKLDTLDAAATEKIATIPPANHKLVTFHDAFPYFAAHYGFDVVGVIVANVGQEPSAADLATLVQTVKAAGVTAVFSESQFNPKLAQTLADEAGITKVVTTLYNDTVGPPPNDTYLTMMEWNVDQVVEALR
jgi:ABC-type Zn uptake system ZnuABC Zn-binding protein ZnuA